jgi:hypothetical protein
MAGPGTELKKLLNFFAIVSDDGCKCDEKAKTMDEWGPDVCETNRSIIISWLAKAARNRKLPFSYFLANTALTVAIRRARASKRQ